MTRMLTIIALLFATPMLAGCASSGEGWGPFTHAAKMGSSNGRQSWVITCSSNAVGYCYQRASKVCPRGFDEISSKDHSSGEIAVKGVAVSTSDTVLKVECQ